MRSAVLNILLLIALSLSSDLSAHGGGTNSYGCYNQSSTSTHHCHSGDYNGLSFSSQEAFLAYIKEQSENTSTAIATTETASTYTTEESVASTYNRDDYLPQQLSNFSYIKVGFEKKFLKRTERLSLILQIK